LARRRASITGRDVDRNHPAAGGSHRERELTGTGAEVDDGRPPIERERHEEFDLVGGACVFLLVIARDVAGVKARRGQAAVATTSA